MEENYDLGKVTRIKEVAGGYCNKSYALWMSINAHTPPPEDHRVPRAFWALFEFLKGDDKYSWTQTNLTDKEFSSAAEILAHLHHCGHGFQKPPGADRAQPRIMQFLPTFKKRFAAFLKKTDGNSNCGRMELRRWQTRLHMPGSILLQLNWQYAARHM